MKSFRYFQGEISVNLRSLRSQGKVTYTSIALRQTELKDLKEIEYCMSKKACIICEVCRLGKTSWTVSGVKITLPNQCIGQCIGQYRFFFDKNVEMSYLVNGLCGESKPLSSY